MDLDNSKVLDFETNYHTRRFIESFHINNDKNTMNEKRHLKALVFLYAFEESVDCHLLSSFCDDSNLHISTMGVSKESISKFLFQTFQESKRDLLPAHGLLFFSTVVSYFTKSYF